MFDATQQDVSLGLGHMFDAMQQDVSFGLGHMFDATQQDVSCGGGVGWDGYDDVLLLLFWCPGALLYAQCFIILGSMISL